MVLNNELPWGKLTGVRPVKIVRKLLEEGLKEKEVFQYMRGKYHVSEEKIQLLLDVAHLELEQLSKKEYEHGYSLYIGIPFCPSICSYCSFSSYPVNKDSNW
jgi:oxygen-independent coproporphyrinogen-3 oxidase